MRERMLWTYTLGLLAAAWVLLIASWATGTRTLAGIATVAAAVATVLAFQLARQAWRA